MYRPTLFSLYYIIILGRIAVLCRPMRPVVTDGVQVAFMVRLLRGLSVTIVDSGGPKEPCIRREAGEVQIPKRMGNFEREKGRPIVKYWDPLASAVSAKMVEPMRCRLGCGLGCAQGSILYLPLMGTFSTTCPDEYD